MASKKKDKCAANPEANVCAHCLAQESPDAKLSICSRCGLVSYCSKDCQRAHWKANHKHHCVSKADRTPPASSSPSTATRIKPPDKDLPPDECAVCLDPLASGAALCTLPCTHTFHAACVEGLRSFGIKQVCPLCRVELPPGPEKLFEEAARRYWNVARRVANGKASWGALTKAEQREINEAFRLCRSAADQGHAGAQCSLGVNYEQGRGVQQNVAEAARWYHKAAEQGDADAQFILGVSYEQGRGVQQNDAEAARWYRKAAEQGHADAQFNLGVSYEQGRGVQQNDAEAARWYHKAAELGDAEAKQRIKLLEDKLRAAAAAIPAASSSRTCAHCGAAETTNGSVALKPCSRCKAVVYCGKECQAAHWKAGGHRAVCKGLCEYP